MRVLTATLSLCVLVLVCQTYGFCANTVTIDTLDFRVCDQTVTLGIYIENDDTLSGLCIPLVIRQTSGSAFPVQSLSITAASRLQDKLTTATQSMTLSTESAELSFWKCDGTGFEARGGADFVSPDAAVFIAAGAPSEYLLPGSDGQNPSLVLQFELDSVAGAFVVDTTCATPNNHLLFVTDSFATVVPTFVADTVVVGNCGCPRIGDPNGSGTINILDVVMTVNVAFKGASPVVDSGCVWENTDITHTGFTNVLDVVGMVNVAFKNGSVCGKNWAKTCGSGNGN